MAAGAVIVAVALDVFYLIVTDRDRRRAEAENRRIVRELKGRP